MANYKGMNKTQLGKVAAERSIAGRSKMSVKELSEAVRKATQSAPTPMGNGKREAAYRAQNGSVKLTPAQIRRATHKAGKVAGRGA